MCFLVVVVTVSPSMKLFSEWDLAQSPDQSGTVVATDKQTGIVLLQSVSTTGVDEVILRPSLLTTWRRHSLRERSHCNKPEGWGAPAPLLPPQVRRHISRFLQHVVGVWVGQILILCVFTRQLVNRVPTRRWCCFQNLQATSRKRPRFAGRNGYEMRESTILKRRSGGDGIQTPRVRCTPTKPVRK